jgi:hypothetical protein
VEKKLGLTMLGTLPFEQDSEEPDKKKKRRKG